MLDIDSITLRAAERNVRATNQNALVEGVELDFSGPFGQRLCDVYSDALRVEGDPTAIAERLAAASLVSSSIFFDDIQSLRSVPELRPSFLQIVLRQRDDFELDDLNVALRPAFWALTPMEQLNALRESYRDAFLPVLDKYSSDELSKLSGSRKT